MGVLSGPTGPIGHAGPTQNIEQNLRIEPVADLLILTRLVNCSATFSQRRANSSSLGAALSLGWAPRARPPPHGGSPARTENAGHAGDEREAIEAIFPETWVQTCIVYEIRASMSYVPDRERKKIVERHGGW
jgi:hypothetical protein